MCGRPFLCARFARWLGAFRCGSSRSRASRFRWIRSVPSGAGKKEENKQNRKLKINLLLVSSICFPVCSLATRFVVFSVHLTFIVNDSVDWACFVCERAALTVRCKWADSVVTALSACWTLWWTIWAAHAAPSFSHSGPCECFSRWRCRANPSEMTICNGATIQRLTHAE